MPDYTMVLDRILNTPLMAHPTKAETVAGVVLRRAGVEVNIAQSFVNDPKAGPLQESVLRNRYEMDGGKCFLFAPELGIAVIEITGSLAHRQWHVGKSSGVMGYDGIGAQFDAAIADDEVKGIVLDVHSAGGEVAGVFPLADRIAAAEKRVVAIADEMAFSAAYLLASSADQVILASEVAQVGSVGVVTIHFSFEQFLENEGIKPTIIQAGEQKADGNPFNDLPDDVRARIQETIDGIYEPFVRRVSVSRGISEQDVRNTEAGTFIGRNAVAVGFADGIADPMEVITALAAEVSDSRPALRAV